MRQGFVLLSDQDTDAPACPAVATVSKDDSWDSGGFELGADVAEAGGLWCDRPYFTGNPTVEWLVGRANRSAAAGAYVQVGNEQNLALEGWTGAPDEWFAFEDAVRAAAAHPERLLAMPPSPGVPGWQEWVRPAGHHAVHAYGSYDEMRGIVEWYLANTAGDVYVTECNFAAGRAVDVTVWTDADLGPFLDWAATQPRVKMAAYFAWRWTGAPPMPTPVDAAGTAVETLLTTWVPPMNGGAPYLWQDTTLTVWNLPDDPAELISWAQQLAAACVEVKTADGSSSWLGEARHLTPDYVGLLRAGLPGVAICGWSYNYCDLRVGPDATTRTPGSRFGQSLASLRSVRSWDRGDGIPEAEAQAAAAAVSTLGLDAHTFDLEVECEGHGDMVSIMLAEARRLMPSTPLGAHTWACKTGHATYPWDAIASGVDVVRPMCYAPTWRAATMYSEDELGLWLAPLVAAPVWGITESVDTVAVLSDDHAVAVAHDAVGDGFWEYSGLPGQPGVVDWIASLADGGVAPAPAYDVDAARDRLWAEAEGLEQHGWPWFGQGIKALVALSKGDR